MKCPIIKRCGGCFYPQDQYQEELKEKTLFIEKEIKKTKLKIDVKPTVASPLVNGYRNKAIVAFNQKYEYGLYEEHSQDIIPYKHCLLHEDIMDEILQYIQSYLRKYRVSIYDRKRHKGLLRHILIRRGVKTDQTMVVLVCNENMWRGSKQFCNQLAKKFPSIKTIVLNVNTRRTPIVLGNEDKVLYGKGFIVDELCGLKFKISPQSFYQINHDQCVNLYTKALSLLNIKGNETAIDAYCGIGTIGMILSQNVKQVIGVESNKDAIKDAKNNARMNQLSNIQFVCDDAKKKKKKLAKKAKIIYECNRFDLKSKKSLRREQKYYLSDLAIYFAMNTDNRLSYGPSLENMVYLYLASQDYQISIGKIGKLECDFITRNTSGDYAYIQVTYTMQGEDIKATERIKEREYRPFRKIRDGYPRYIVSLDRFRDQQEGVHHINAIDLFLGKEKI